MDRSDAFGDDAVLNPIHINDQRSRSEIASPIEAFFRTTLLQNQYSSATSENLMDLVKALNLRASLSPFSLVIPMSNFYFPPRSPRNFSFQFRTYPFHHFSSKSLILRAKRGKSESEPVLDPTIVEEVSMDDEEDVLDDFEYGRATLILFFVSDSKFSLR